MAIQMVTGKPGEGMTLPDSTARFLRSLSPAQRLAFLAGLRAGVALGFALSQPGQPAPDMTL